MPRTIIATPDAPSSPLYAQGVKAGAQVFVSGTVGIDPVTAGIAGGDHPGADPTGAEELRGDPQSRRRDAWGRR